MGCVFALVSACPVLISSINGESKQNGEEVFKFK